MSSDTDRKLFVPPPLYFLMAFLVGWWLHALTDDRLGGRPATIWIGAVLLTAGVVLDVWATLTFKRARTTFIPYRRASSLVTGGPYKLSRNPMYVGMALDVVGGALLIDSWWPLVLLVPAIVLVTVLVIKPEERLMADVFGSEYTAYRERVRRWL
ncbi:methyltransferase family protein [Aeromicrobium sp.]|uniref:methyltransferase family protein n=1 Tax=Aeromicrobium sp. TaxID=1871063 RepID=UPI003D6B8731